MPLLGGVAIGGGALLGGIGNFFGGKEQADASVEAARIQAQATQLALNKQQQNINNAVNAVRAAQREAIKYAQQQANITRQDLKPLQELGLKSILSAQGLIDPNSAESQAERDAFNRVLTKNLAARGLTASGTEIAGLSDFELGLARERRNTALGLAGVGQNLVRSKAELESQLGANISNILSQTGANVGSIYGSGGANLGNLIAQGGAQAAQLAIAQGQANSNIYAGINNAFQAGLSGIGQLYSQNRQNQFNQQLLSGIFGAGGGGGSPLTYSTPSYGYNIPLNFGE